MEEIAKESNYVCSLDIGSTKLVATIAEIHPDGVPNILTMRTRHSKGIEKGVVTNFDVAAVQVKEVLDEAAKYVSNNIEIRNVVLSVSGGEHIKSHNSKTVVTLPVEEVRAEDLERHRQEAEKIVSAPKDQTLLHLFPQEYKVDNSLYTKNPLNQTGMQLQGNMHVITCDKNWLKNITKLVESTGVEVGRVVYSGVASSYCALNDNEKEMGVCLIDIGGGTIDVVLYTGGLIRFSRSYPFGGKDITEYLSRSFGTAFNEAEYVKVTHGSAVSPPMSYPDKKIEMPKANGVTTQKITKQYLSQYTHVAYQQLFQLIINDLNEIFITLQQEKLPCYLGAGIVLTGGASQIEGLVECAKNMFHCDVRIGRAQQVEGLKDIAQRPDYTTSVGLIQYSFYHDMLPSRVENNDSLLDTLRTNKWLKKFATLLKGF